MHYVYPLIFALSAAFALPTTAVAHSDGEHAAEATSPTKEAAMKAGEHAAHDGGHATALRRPAALDEAKQTIEISMNDRMRFVPAHIQVKRGQTVRFVVSNQGQLEHEMVLGSLAELKKHAVEMAKFPAMKHDDPNAISVPAGKTGEFAWTFTTAGQFDFACLVPGHFEAGMQGQIMVAD